MAQSNLLQTKKEREKKRRMEGREGRREEERKKRKMRKRAFSAQPPACLYPHSFELMEMKLLRIMKTLIRIRN